MPPRPKFVRTRAQLKCRRGARRAKCGTENMILSGFMGHYSQSNLKLITKYGGSRAPVPGFVMHFIIRDLSLCTSLPAKQLLGWENTCLILEQTSALQISARCYQLDRNLVPLYCQLYFKVDNHINNPIHFCYTIFLFLIKACFSYQISNAKLQHLSRLN